ncbi:MAG: pilin [Patescibacteria group bacterium]
MFFRIFLLIFTISPVVVMAQVEPLVGIPGVTTDNNGVTNVTSYVNALYVLAISVAGLLAVIKIVIAGAKYVLSDIVTTKQDAIKDIRGALVGLLIVLAAVLILFTINPRLLEFNVIFSPVNTQPAAPTTNSGSNVTGPTSCPSGQSINTQTTPGGIMRTCINNADNPLLGDLPTQDDVTPGNILRQQRIPILCSISTACGFPTATGFQVGISSARETCQNISGGTGQFTVDQVGSGLCLWEEEPISGGPF